MDTTIFAHYIEKEEDVLSLIRTRTEENINLDYKACASLQKTDGKTLDDRMNEISKDVSAFANSDGGTIIYGVKEKGHVPIDTDDGYDPNKTTKEWLEQVINSRIKPRIDGILIKSIPLKSKNPSKVIYAVHIPQSTTAHQAYDKKYYKRFNFESVPMEDHEIRDVMNRSKYPIIDVCSNHKKTDIVNDMYFFLLSITLKNIGSICAEHIKFVIEIPRFVINLSDYQHQIDHHFSRKMKDNNYMVVELNPVTNKRVEIMFKFSPPDNILFPDDEKEIPFNFQLEINSGIFDKIQSEDSKIIWRIYADNMPSRTGYFHLIDLDF